MTYRKPDRRIYCPACGRDVGVKQNGYPYKHGKRPGCLGARVRVYADRTTLDPVVSRAPSRETIQRNLAAARRAS